MRVMGLKEDVRDKLPAPRDLSSRNYRRQCSQQRYVAWLGRLIPGRFDTIEQNDIGRAFVAEFIDSSTPNGVVDLENGAMRQRSRELDSPQFVRQS